MSSAPNNPPQGDQNLSTATSDNKKPLPLPSPPPKNADGETTKLDVSGEGSTVKLDHLGPLVVHQDGTVSRIGNWAEMNEIERKNTLRILGKRNQLRLSNLRAAAQAEESQGTEDGKS